jgi:hypothetical protein
MPGVLYHNGDILTMEPQLYAQAVLVEDGRIRAVGPKQQLEAAGGPGIEEFDLQGRTLMPAFIDPHSHITAYASTLALADLSQAKSFAEIKQTLLEFLKQRELKKGAWLIGFGYDHNRLAEHEHPDKMLLNTVSSEIPIMITHKSGHMGAVNQRALEIASIRAGTPDPEGGQIGRVEGSREPSGYLEEKAFMALAAHVPAPGIKEQKALLQQAEREYLKYGVATVQDGLLQEQGFALLRDTPLTVDVVGFADLKQSPAILRDHPEYREGYRDHLRLGGYKIILDGSPQGCTAWMSEPYENAPDGYRGYPVYSDEQVVEFIETALRDRAQLLTHCNGDAAAEQLITCYERAMAAHPGLPDLRPVMIHAQTVRRDQLERMKKLHMIPSFFIAHTYYWGDVHRSNFGKRAYSISPARSALALDLPYTFHQDTPVLPPDMLHTVQCAVTRTTESGSVLGREECISPLEALRGVTVNAAYQYFEEVEKGSIRAGKRADLIILSANPLKVPAHEIGSIEVLAAIKDGVVRYQQE